MRSSKLTLIRLMRERARHHHALVHLGQRGFANAVRPGDRMKAARKNSETLRRRGAAGCNALLSLPPQWN